MAKVRTTQMGHRRHRVWLWLLALTAMLMALFVSMSVGSLWFYLNPWE